MLQQLPSKIDWPQAYFMAESDGSEFVDIQIVTARSENDHRLSEMLFLPSLPLTTPTIRESVEITTAGITTVIINVDQITDDALWPALDMVAHAMDELNGYPGIVYFGDPLTFPSTDIIIH